jgi:glucosamine-phosphate N-acetyltransferase
VAKDQQGKKLGLHIIHALDHIGEKIGCYKVRSSEVLSDRPPSPFLSCSRAPGQASPLSNHQTILDCSEANEGFYVKCGYKRVGLEMAHYYETTSKS